MKRFCLIKFVTVALGFVFASQITEALVVTNGTQLWLDAADSSTLLDPSGDNPGDAGFDGTIQTWQDKSGNTNHATAFTNDLPVYTAGALNNQAVIGFNTNTPATGTQAFSLSSNIALPRETMFFVLRMFDNGDNRGSWVSDSPTLSVFQNDANRYFWNTLGNGGNFANSAPQTFQVVTETRDPASTTFGQFTVYEDGVNQGSYTGTLSFPATQTITFSKVGVTTAFSRYFYGQMAEVIIYSNILNTAERVLVENYLSSKFGTTLAGGDHYLGDTVGNAHHDFDVFGIGQDVATTLSPAGKHSASAGDAISLLELNNSLADGEFALAGHDTTSHGVSVSNLPSGVRARWNRDYYLDITGTVDTRFTFDFSIAGLGTPLVDDEFSLLYRTSPNGTFVNLGLTPTVNGNTVSFDLLGYTDSNDGFYTLGIPEPGAMALLAVGGMFFLWRRR